MNLSFRWYGQEDSVSLEYIKQIPGMKSIVTAIYDIPVGEIWPVEKIREIKQNVEKYGLEISAIESLPVHEDIKIGLDTRDIYIKNYCQTIRNLSEVGIKVVCYNFMPVFDWTRTNLDYINEDNSTSLIYEDSIAGKIDPSSGELELPGWDTSYEKNELKRIFDLYKNIDSEKLWEHLEYFILEVAPVAKECDVLLAIHPDDPPWEIFGLPRIITDDKAIARLLALYDDKVNGLTFCTGSLGAGNPIQIPVWIRKFGSRINFMHVRNIKVDDRNFHETAHLSETGSVDMYEVMKALYDVGFKGPLRPDHGRMIWDEKGRAGYGLYDRALGATYLNGIWEAIIKTNKELTCINIKS